jgi:hypothetical protein
MSTLEDRVRAAARAAAATVAEGSAPPLRLAPPGRDPGPLGWNGRHRWIVPLASAAAVIALIVAAHAVVPGTRRPAPGRPSAALPLLSDGLPAYFLELPFPDQVGPQPSTANPIPSQLRSRETLHVMATATGKVAARATLPGYVTAIAASRGAFFAAVVKDNLASFYEIRLNDSHTATTVTELPMRPDTAPLAFMAVSPDGTKIAYSTDAIHGASGKVHNLVVASTNGGSQREWLTPPQDSHGSMVQMTWLADGRALAFDWDASFSPDNPSASSLRLLDTEAPGSDLMADTTLLPSASEARLFFNDLATLSPDGQVVIGAASGKAASRAPAGSLLAISTATGEITVLYRVTNNPYPGNGCYLRPLWISNAGSEVLATCFQGFGSSPKTWGYRVNVVLINHGHATVLPWLSADAEEGVAVMAFP